MKLREELREINEYILGHPMLKEAEEGSLSMDVVKAFAVNQLYIVPHDFKALMFMASKGFHDDEAEFFKLLADGDYKALKALRRLAEELGVRLDPSKVIPEAVAYTHYLSWLALNATPGEAAVAITVNLPVWGQNTSRLAKALRNRYGLRSLEFLEMFSGPYEELERAASPIIERYLDLDRYRLVSRTIQAYERMFWDAVYMAGHSRRGP